MSNDHSNQAEKSFGRENSEIAEQVSESSATFVQMGKLE